MAEAPTRRQSGLEAEPFCGFDHVGKSWPRLLPLARFQSAVRIDPNLIDGEALFRLVEKRDHLLDTRAARGVDVINAGANLVGIAVASERFQKLHLRARGLDRYHVSIQGADGLDDVVELRIAHVGVYLRLVGNPG